MQCLAYALHDSSLAQVQIPALIRVLRNLCPGDGLQHVYNEQTLIAVMHVMLADHASNQDPVGRSCCSSCWQILLERHAEACLDLSPVIAEETASKQLGAGTGHTSQQKPTSCGTKAQD